jgi:hypothetical protein
MSGFSRFVGEGEHMFLVYFKPKQPYLRTNDGWESSEAEFLDVIGTQVLSVFLLASQSHLYTKGGF